MLLLVIVEIKMSCPHKKSLAKCCPAIHQLVNCLPTICPPSLSNSLFLCQTTPRLLCQLVLSFLAQIKMACPYKNSLATCPPVKCPLANCQPANLSTKPNSEPGLVSDYVSTDQTVHKKSSSQTSTGQLPTNDMSTQPK